MLPSKTFYLSCDCLGVGVTVVNRLLYAIGGFDGKNRLQSVERYNPDEDSWTYVAEMSTPRSGAGKYLSKSSLHSLDNLNLDPFILKWHSNLIKKHS